MHNAGCHAFQLSAAANRVVRFSGPASLSLCICSAINFTDLWKISLMQDCGPVHNICASCVSSHPGLHGGQFIHHHVRRHSQRGPCSSAVPRYLPGAREPRTEPGGGPVCQAHLPLSLARDTHKMDTHGRSATVTSPKLISNCHWRMFLFSCALSVCKERLPDGVDRKGIFTFLVLPEHFHSWEICAQ